MKEINNAPVRLRFAPSPTGFLHLGNYRTALFGYLIAKNLGGKFLLRIEDTDQKREVAGAVENLVSILSWLGVKFDEGATIGGPHAPYVQTQRLDIYHKYSAELLAAGHSYRCFCSPERLEEMRQDQQTRKLAPRYDRRCRDLSGDEVAQRLAAGEPFVIRQKMPLQGTIVVKDELRGEISFAAADLDDHVLIKSNGIPTYQFANIVDDHLMEITHVTRGDEWLGSFPKNILLYQAFGWTPPKFIHLPLILNKTGGKLSKRQGDVFVEEFKERGYLPEALTNFCALLGWHPRGDNELLTLAELERLFSISGMGTSPAVFDEDKLDFFNAHYLRQKSVSELADLARPHFEKSGIFLEEDALQRLAEVARDRLKKMSDIVALSSSLISLPVYEPELLRWKKLTLPESLAKLAEVTTYLEGLPVASWNKEALEKSVLEWIKSRDGQNGDYLWPLRAALTGQKYSPGPFEVAWAIGRDESLRRLKLALSSL